MMAVGSNGIRYGVGDSVENIGYAGDWTVTAIRPNHTSIHLAPLVTVLSPSGEREGTSQAFAFRVRVA